MARPKAQDRIEITDPGELLDLAKSAVRKRMDATGEDRSDGDQYRSFSIHKSLTIIGKRQ